MANKDYDIREHVSFGSEHIENLRRAELDLEKYHHGTFEYIHQYWYANRANAIRLCKMFIAAMQYDDNNVYFDTSHPENRQFFQVLNHRIFDTKTLQNNLLAAKSEFNETNRMAVRARLMARRQTIK